MKNNVLCGSVLMVLFGIFVWLMATFFWPSQIFILNDFTDITSRTLIHVPEQSLHHQTLLHASLDTIDYTNRNRLFDLYRYNPLTRTIPPLSALSGILIIDASQITALTSHELLVYNPRSSQILISEPDNAEKHTKILHLFSNPQDRQHIEAFYHQWAVQKALYKNRSLATEEAQFIHNNRYEASASCLVWHYFHHHEAMFGPINAYHLGKADSDNHFFYGWLSNLSIANLMLATGDFNFQHYLTVLYSVYPIYYFFWIALMYFLTRDLGFSLLATVLGLGSVYLIGFEEIRFQPGLNPLRHYLDLPTIAVFALFLQVTSRWRYAWLAIALMVATIAIFNGNLKSSL